MLRLSVVTPSFNQARFLPANLQSIAASGADVEHIVVDGGSTDGSVDLLAAAKHIAHWVSEPDAGQYDALNKGFKRTTGEIMAWLNSDDMYFPWTIGTVLQIFHELPEIEWLTTRYPTAIDEHGNMIQTGRSHGFERKGFMAGVNLPNAGWPADRFIQQESTFWRRSLWERAGGFIDTRYSLAGDFELWTRFFQHAELYAADVPLGTYRRQDDQKTTLDYGGYLDQAKDCLVRAGGVLPDPEAAGWRLKMRRDPVWKEALIQLGLADWAPIVTHDWNGKFWFIEKN